MKKIIFAFILGALLSTGIATAVAMNKPAWYITDILNSSFLGTYEKTYDENTNVVCYVYDGYQGNGISCLKNN